MIADSTMYFGAALWYAAVFAVLLVRLRSVEGSARKICGAATAIIGVSTVAYVLMGLGVTVEFAGGTLDLPNLIDDVIAYTGVYAITAALAGASVRLIGAAAVTVMVPTSRVRTPVRRLRRRDGGTRRCSGGDRRLVRRRGVVRAPHLARRRIDGRRPTDPF